MSTLAQRKEALRRQMQAQRTALPPDRARAAAEAVAHHLVGLVLEHGARRVALYSAMRSEVDPDVAHAELARHGVELVYPRVAQRTLTFHPITKLTSLGASRLGIPEPGPDSPAIDLAEIELLVVPGLAFDAAGGRLGWGGGYYDSVLARAGALSAGILFSFQLVDEVPRSPSDRPVDFLITEHGVRRAAATSTR